MTHLRRRLAKLPSRTKATNRWRVYPFLLALPLAVFGDDSNLSYDNCGSAMIGLGDSSFRVREKCGKPSAIDVISGGEDEGERRERWYYQGSRSRDARTYTFVGGVLKKIEAEANR